MAKRLKAAERRRQLLEVAADVFAKRGYHGATTAELARAAGVTEPILYRHFRNKLDLFVTLIEEVGQEVLAAWRRNLDGIECPHRRLEALLIGNPATHDRGQAVYRVFFQSMTNSSVDRRIRSALRLHIASLKRFLEEEIESLQRQGAVRRDVRARDLALAMIDIAVGFGMVAPLRVSSRSLARGKSAMQNLLHELIACR